MFNQTGGQQTRRHRTPTIIETAREQTTGNHGNIEVDRSSLTDNIRQMSNWGQKKDVTVEIEGEGHYLCLKQENKNNRSSDKKRLGIIKSISDRSHNKTDEKLGTRCSYIT